MKFRSENGNAMIGAIWAAVLLSVVLLVPYFIFGRSVPPTAIGVR